MSLKVRALQFTAAGLIALAGYEGYERLPYKDSGGVWTDGFGNTHNVVPGKPVEVTAALVQLNKNTVSAQNAVNRCITSYMSDQTFSSLVSFSFNVGNDAFCKSTLVRKFNAGDKHAACNDLMRWNKAGGHVIEGLTRRREQERLMCLEGLQ
jgi:lysozyme